MSNIDMEFGFDELTRSLESEKIIYGLLVLGLSITMTAGLIPQLISRDAAGRYTSTHLPLAHENRVLGRQSYEYWLG